MNSFEDMKYQFQDEWLAIEGDSGPKRNGRIVKLAHMLLEWESEQSKADLSKPLYLLRAARWDNLIKLTHKESAAIADHYGDAKKDITEELISLSQQIEESQQTSLALRTEIETLGQKLELAQTDLESVQQEQERCHGELDALKELDALVARLAEAREACSSLMARLTDTGDAMSVMGTVKSLAKITSKISTLLNQHYQANDEIQIQLSKLSQEIDTQQQSLEKLGAVAALLKESDQLLATQINAQDKIDAVVKERS